MKTKLFLLTILFSLIVPFMAFGAQIEGDTHPKKRKKKKKASLEIRDMRKIALTAESGWNTLSGAGLNVSYCVNPRIAIDAGAGFNLQGIKGGLRGRYFLSTNNFAPYFGLGLLRSGLSGTVRNIPWEDENGIQTATYNLAPSALMQLTFGGEYIANGGFVVGVNIGYALLLTGDSITVTSGALDEQEAALIRLLTFGGGASIALNLGYAF